MSVLATAKFWVAAAERAAKTFAQSLLALLGGNMTGVLGVNWGDALAVSGLATLASVLTSIVSAGAGNSGPSLATEELTPPADGPVGGDDSTGRHFAAGGTVA